MHGGKVEAASDGPGRGSTFTVVLPTVLAASADDETPNIDSRARSAARRRILVVDDNVDGAEALTTLLDIMGNHTQAAHDGLHALDAAETFRPDVILMDIGMPKLNGFDACRRIREQPWGKEIVIVACTGWGQEDDKRMASEAGFNFHMTKPIDPGALETMLADLGTSE